MKKLSIMALLSTILSAVLLLPACQPDDAVTTIAIAAAGETMHISRNQAIAIASNQIPPDSLSQAEVNVYFDSEPGMNGSWVVYFQHLHKTRTELEEFGWQEGSDTSFGDLPDDLDEYYGAMIYIDVETGDVLSKAAGIWLGGPIRTSTPTEAADDVILTPGGPRYRANFHQEGVTSPWPPIETSDILLSGSNNTVNLTYRADIETKAGEARSNILLINTTVSDIQSLNLYAVGIPSVIEVKERMRWRGSLPSIITPVLLVEVSQDAKAQEYTFEIGLEINDVDYGTFTCRVRVSE